jgi:hypothetical protein
MSPGEERRGHPPRFRGGCCTSRAADVIASDRSLRDLGARHPRDLGQLLDVYGFGQTKPCPTLVALICLASRPSPSSSQRLKLPDDRLARSL